MTAARSIYLYILLTSVNASGTKPIAISSRFERSSTRIVGFIHKKHRFVCYFQKIVVPLHTEKENDQPNED
jgi:hypothetical protein